MSTQVTIEELEDALVDGSINMQQFFSVLVDNYGLTRATEIMIYNLKLAESKWK